MSILDRALRIGEGKKFKEFQQQVARINDLEAEMELLEDEELSSEFTELRERAANGTLAMSMTSGFSSRGFSRAIHHCSSPSFAPFLNLAARFELMLARVRKRRFQRRPGLHSRALFVRR